MNLLFYFTHQISPSAGGVERVMAALYDRLIMMGYQIFIIYTKPCILTDCIPGQIQLPALDGGSLENQQAITNIIKEKGIDIVINLAAIFNRNSLAITNACIHTGTSLVSVYHNTLDWPLWSNKITHKWMRYDILRKFLSLPYSWIQKFPFRKNAHFISQSSNACVMIGKCYEKQFLKLLDSAPHYLCTIFNPLGIEKDSSVYVEKKHEALFVGRLSEPKNVGELLSIWSKVKRKDWILNIVGDGPLMQHLIDRTKELGVEDSVRFIGNTKHPEEYYKTAKIFLMASHFEGFPMTLIECQAYGCVPIIYDSYPAASEIIHDNMNGFLIKYKKQMEFSETLSAVIAEEIDIERLSNNCLAEVGKYELSTIANQWDKLFKLISSSKVLSDDK